ncbi:hypothetical protein JG688_00018221 [Phytophthora aleatoria]|uniref:Uncharacterized protein n=1 Tax=Phytophthora aleatoria TaxID=2496075 RepID=A0A8J5MBN4_9STRA|nr:hypothetical protein JG688_00018221 [Phytophthora aleatoria]
MKPGPLWDHLDPRKGEKTVLTELEIHEQESFAAALALTSLQSTPEHIVFPVLQYD